MDSSKSNDQGVRQLVSVNQQGSKIRYQDRPKGEKQDFSTSSKFYNDILTKLIAYNLVHPFDPTKLCISEIKPWRWDVKAYCKFQNGIGYNVENCGKLKHII